ncbi:MAG: fatty acid desaturase DesE [Calditrichia bacterium]
MAEPQIKDNQSAYKKLLQSLAPYRNPRISSALWQLLNSLIPYTMLWVLMIFSMKNGYSYWITLGLSVVAAGFLVRIFIIFHDCCHGSFFGSKKANRILGYITGVLTFTAYRNWRRAHLVHHATSGDLDHRGVGDVWMLTVAEYTAAPPWKRLSYRFYRNPFVMFGLGPAFTFFINQRYYRKDARKSERRNVIATNVAILLLAIGLSLAIGFKTYLLIQLPVMLIGGLFGVWLFYVQHQFEGTYWSRQENWDPLKASLEGSSYYKLPKILKWFSGNIGLHHIHHIDSSIPNYNLQRCYDEIPIFQEITPLTIRRSLKSLRLRLWDEERRELVGLSALRRPVTAP